MNHTTTTAIEPEISTIATIATIEHHPEVILSNDTNGDAVIDYSTSNTNNNNNNNNNTNKKGGSRPPIQLEWKDLYFEVMVRADIPAQGNPLTKLRYLFKKEKRTILFPMSGHVAPGECLAIMGPSGAGKTSLLNILAQRTRAKGEVTVNGQNIGKSFRALSAFVQQDDVLMGTMTVRETLRYASLLRLGSEVSLKEKRRRVLAVADELGLTKCLDTYVGTPGITKGISGGERKRLAIAIELLSEPSILFLDEPTSGLDAKTAQDVIKAIRRLAENGRAVVMTIHQPRSDIYKLFDKLLLLARGKVAYFGEANRATSYFTRLESLDPEKKPDMFKCPSDFNPADFFIDLITESTSNNPEERQLDSKRIDYILDYYSNNYVYHKPEMDAELDPNLKKYGSYKSMWIVQLAVLTWRSLVSIARDKMLTNARFFQTIIMGVVIGLIFLRLDNSQSSVQNKVGVLYFVLTFSIMGGIFGSVITFLSAEKPVFMRERGAKAYRVSSYYLGKTIAELPSNFIFPVLLSVIVYWMVGLNPTAPAFFTFLVIVIVLSITAQSMGMLIAAVAPSMEVAQAITPVIMTLFMLFGGFYLNVDNIPPWFIWIYWISIFHFGLEAFVINEFKNSKISCTVPPCMYTSGNQVISSYGMDQRLSNIWIDIGFLGVLIVFCRVMAYIVILLKKPRGG